MFPSILQIGIFTLYNRLSFVVIFKCKPDNIFRLIDKRFINNNEAKWEQDQKGLPFGYYSRN
jgi:hypothetical protein